MHYKNERPLVVITQKVHREVIEYLGQTCRVWPNDGSEPLEKSTLLSRAAQADALMVFMPDRIDEVFLQQCPRLKVIGAALKGYTNFDEGENGSITPSGVGCPSRPIRDRNGGGSKYPGSPERSNPSRCRKSAFLACSFCFICPLKMLGSNFKNMPVLDGLECFGLKIR
jgi:hypothetical protein